MILFRHKKAVAWAGLLIAGLLVVLIAYQSFGSPKFLKQPPGPRKSRLYFLCSWAAPVRTFWLRTKNRFFGPTPLVVLDVDVFQLRDPIALKSLSLPKPLASNKIGEQFWILDPNGLKALNTVRALQDSTKWTAEQARTIHSIQAPMRVKPTDGAASFRHGIFLDGLPASVFSGQSVLVNGQTMNVGVEFYAQPRIRRSEFHLEWFAKSTTVITQLIGRTEHRVLHTNLFIGASCTLRTNESFLLLTEAGADGQRWGVILSPTPSRLRPSVPSLAACRT